MLIKKRYTNLAYMGNSNHMFWEYDLRIHKIVFQVLKKLLHKLIIYILNKKLFNILLVSVTDRQRTTKLR